MLNFENLKKTWHGQTALPPGPTSYDQASLEKLIRTRVNKHLKASLQYFWASFALQMLMYALLGHVTIKYWQDAEMRTFTFGGILLYLPFTLVLLHKFKRMATIKPSGPANAVTSLHDFVLRQQTLLRSFYKFKKRYELILIPLSTAIGVFVTFRLFVPGGVAAHWTGAAITYILSLLSYLAAIRAENRKGFEKPIQQLQAILDEFRGDPDG